jgi:hypothetical protein
LDSKTEVQGSAREGLKKDGSWKICVVQKKKKKKKVRARRKSEQRKAEGLSAEGHRALADELSNDDLCQ